MCVCINDDTYLINWRKMKKDEGRKKEKENMYVGPICFGNHFLAHSFINNAIILRRKRNICTNMHTSKIIMVSNIIIEASVQLLMINSKHKRLQFFYHSNAASTLECKFNEWRFNSHEYCIVNYLLPRA